MFPVESPSLLGEVLDSLPETLPGPGQRWMRREVEGVWSNHLANLTWVEFSKVSSWRSMSDVYSLVHAMYILRMCVLQ